MIRSRTLTRRLALLTSALMVMPSGAFAAPQGLQGPGTVQQNGNTTNINQNVQNGIWSASGFNTNANEKVNVFQPGSGSNALFRIGDPNPTSFGGSLWSNGHVFLINPNGFLFGSGAQINTAGFLASTYDIKNHDFKHGRYIFNIPGRADASIVNLGHITITPGTSGFAALVAPGVRNAGVITANLGQVGLASAGNGEHNGFTLDFYGDKLITLQVGDKVAGQVIDVATGQPLTSLVSNEGKIKANGGQVTLTAGEARTIVDSVINNTGVIEANSVGTKNGMIVLGAATDTSAGAPTQTVKVSGTLSARGRKTGETGGTVQITGQQVALVNAKVDASGQAGGGTVRVGDRAKSTSVSVDAGTTVDVSAKTKGDAGKVYVLSNGLTSVNGTILAMGGALGGNGGFVETSGATVNFTGIQVDTSAVAGLTGNWLIDPTNLTIDREDAATIASMLAKSNVTLTTTSDGASGPGDRSRGRGDIIVEDAVTWSSSNTLTLNAYHDIDVRASITGANGGLSLIAGHDIDVGGNVHVAAFMLNAGNNISATKSVDVGTFTLQNGFWSQVDWRLPTFSATDFRITGGTFLRATGGNGSTWSPYRITDVYGLQGIGSPSGKLISKNFVLGNDIDANGTANWNGGQGFVPIGNGETSFAGSLNGQGNTIDGLTINSSSQYVGLFGSIGHTGSISNLGLTNVSVLTDGSSQYLGALAGSNSGNVSNSYSSGQVGNVNGSTPPDTIFGAFGGLVGLNSGSVSQSHSTAAVHVKSSINFGYVDGGGLVGQNLGTITNSYAGGAVVGTNSSISQSYLGGLVGWNNGGQISQSYATGAVTGTGSWVDVGGLVGSNSGSVTQSYASGAASAQADNAFVGGLVGSNNGAVTQSYATGSASAGSSSYVGGLVGQNVGTIDESFASGFVSGGPNTALGGLVGSNSVTFPGVGNAPTTFVGTVTNSYWDKGTTGQLHSDGSADSFGLSTADSFKQSSYVGWDFSAKGGTWFMVDGQTRPFLQSEWSTTITNAHQLQLMAMNLNANYKLANDINLASALANPSGMWSSQGFSPVGQPSNGFAGSFDGRGNTISGLAIAPTDPGVNNIGLFGFNTGIIRNVSLTDVSITANPNADAPSQFVGALVGQNFGMISNVSVTGTVNGGTSSGVIAGGLVGQNGVSGDGNDDSQPLIGTIRNAHADVAVTIGSGVSCDSGDCNGGWNYAGGLVGINDGKISRSSSSGDVASGTNSFAGGLVGFNSGIIHKAFVAGQPNTDTNVDSKAETVVAPTVHVGANGTAGGLVGVNIGTIRKTFATATVTGDAGVGISHDGGGQTTSLGGLVGENEGVIARSFATGDVGTLGVNQLEAGGLVGFNSGTIWRSFATGNVSAGGGSSAGGLVGDNNHNDFSCTSCAPGFGQNDNAFIGRSFAFGDVTVGAGSLAGGVAASNGGTLSRTHASGTVSGGNNSILGGLVGVNSLDSLIRFSGASGPVTSTGPNSVIAGLVGINGGDIVNSRSTAVVTGDSNSYVGGLVGINIGSVLNSQVTGDAAVTVNGSGNAVGGFVGVNLGLIGVNPDLIDPSSTSVTPTGDRTTNIVGGFAGANPDFGTFTFPVGLPLPPPSFPTGTIDRTINTTSDTTHPFIGTDVTTTSPSPQPLPTLPQPVFGCNDPLCQILVALPLNNGPPPPQLPDNPPGPSFNPTPPVIQQVVPPPANFNTQPTTINLTLNNPGTPGGGGNGGNGGNGAGGPRSPGPPPGPGIGRTYSEQHFSGVPPIGETRFLPGEIVVQVVNTIPTADILRIAQQLGMTLISSQDISGRVIYRFKAGNGRDERRLIAALEKQQIVASAQPNYLFALSQAPSPPQISAPQTVPAVPPPAATNVPPAAPNTDTTGAIPPPAEAAPELSNADTAALSSLPAGDAAQYVIDKLHLSAVHRLASGRNVSVAVIDSEIDIQHPDLRGVISERYDTTKTESHPHSHGTGMAGAIASRYRLLGVAPGVKLIAIKAFDESATSAEATSYAILKGLDYAMSKNVRIINMSFAGPHDPMMERTLKTAHDQGIILIAAAGNAGPKSPPLYPGADASVIAVTATDYTDKPFAMANRGKYIAVAAPGVDVMVPAPGNSYQLTTGTSVAAAHVSGVAALLVENKPGITPDEVRQVLMHTAKAMNVKGKDDLDGAGLVDPVGALQAINPAKSAEILQRINGASLH